MPKKKDPGMAAALALRPRLRVLRDAEIALGPGKVDLLESIAATGSIAEAARQLGMSYMRAWKLVRSMNACFRAPLVLAARGGLQRGGAELTRDGHTALRLYRRMESESRAAAERNWRALRRLLRP